MALPRVPEEKIELIKSRINIVDVISQYLKLEKRGRNYVAVCPFHQDSHPSLSVNVEKQIFRCFACSAGGNAISFIKDFKQVSFLEALREMAEMADVQLDELNHLSEADEVLQSQQQKMYELNQIAANYYANNLLLPASQRARDYLKSRFISDEQIERFTIGFANDGDDLLKIMEKKGYDVKQLEEVGLVSSNYRITTYFHSRIMFPIKNDSGMIIGFSGRMLASDAKQLKYLNTPETAIFKKQEIMYNLDQAKNFVRQANSIILLEGYMDVIALHKIGIDNAVAIMGTNVSSYHLQKIKNLTQNVYLFLDGDRAGVQAMIKSSSLLLKTNLTVKIVDNETPHDPDELVNLNQGDLIREMIKNAMHPISYLLKLAERKGLAARPEDTKQLVSQLETLFSSIPDAIERNIYLNEISNRMKIDKAVLIEQFGAKEPARLSEETVYDKPLFSSKRDESFEVYGLDESLDELLEETLNQSEFSSNNENFSAKPIIREEPVFRNNRFYNSEGNTILMMLASRRAADYFVKNIGFMNFGDFRLLANYIVDYYAQNENVESISIGKLSTLIKDGRLLKLVSEIYDSSIISHQYREKALQDYGKLINDYAALRDLEMLRVKQKQALDIEEKISLGINMEKIAKKIKN